MKIPFLLAIVALVHNASADTTIGLNFCDHWANPHVADGTADGFAAWTDSRATGDTTDPAVQSTPLALGTSGVEVTWNSSNIWPAGAEDNNEQALYREYLDDGQTNAGVGVRVTITGLGAWLSANGCGHYEIRCYTNNDAANTFQPILVRGGSTSSSPVLQTITPMAKGNGSYPTSGALGTGESRGYGDSPSSLAEDIITLTIPPRSGSTRGTLCAFKITASGPPPGPPEASSWAVLKVTDTSAILHGMVIANGLPTQASFEYGPTTVYGSSVAAWPASLTSDAVTTVRATLGNLSPDTTYHYRVAATNTAGTSHGLDQVFTTAKAVFLSDLSVSHGALTPAFSESVTRYAVQVPYSTSSIQVTPAEAAAGSTIRVQGVPVASGAASGAIPLAVGNTTITTAVTGPEGTFANQYMVVVTRLPPTYTFHSAASALVTTAAFDASGEAATLDLNFAPPTGTTLTVVNNTGIAPLQGEFTNLAQGQRVDLSFGGITYPFVANYYGGTGNDLVLQWANTRIVAWGTNDKGQLGSTARTNNNIPEAVDGTGVLAGKSILAVAGGWNHCLALCSDGTVAAWGSDSKGQLGHSGVALSTLVPVAVDQTGVLADKTVIAIAAGGEHSLALCTDGSLAGWGSDRKGQLGYNGEGNSITTTPVLIPATGVLAGKTVTAISAGGEHSLALCSDGTVAAWGSNASGQVGNNQTSNSNVPALVDRSGALAGKTVTAISAGTAHSLVLCSDGTLAVWGLGLPGNDSETESKVPVLVDQSGVLSGKTPCAIAAGNESRVLCTDGTSASWGAGYFGQVPKPVLVSPSPVWAGRVATSISAGKGHALVRFSDGFAAAWGNGWYGQLGIGRTDFGYVPHFVHTSGLTAGERFVALAGGDMHSLGITASPPPALVTTLAATDLTDTGATLNALVGANNVDTTVAFEFGLTSAYGSTIVATPETVTGTGTSTVTALLTGLSPGTIYHYRVVATNLHGITFGDDMTFPPNNPPSFAGHSVGTPWQTPADIPLPEILGQVTDPEGDSVSVTAAGPASVNGGTATLLAGLIRYTPPSGFSGADRFQVAITDSGGASVTGTVTVNIGSAPADDGNPPLVLTQLPGGKMGIAFQGIPGRSYPVQRSVDLLSWVTITILTTDAASEISFIDESPPPGRAFYRLGLP